MEPTSRFTLEKHQGPYETWPSTSRLFVDGAAVDTRVRGFVIDGQYETALGTLLLTSYDCPYEEASAFTLLDGDQRILATRELGAPYASYGLHAHWPVDALTLALHLDGDRFYTLHVQAPGRMPWQRHRLVLRDVRDWMTDPRMRDSQERRARELEAIGIALAASARDDVAGDR